MTSHQRQTEVLRAGKLSNPRSRLKAFTASGAAPERLRVLFTLGDPYLPQRAGGAQSSTHQLVRALLAEGHAAAVLSGLEGGGWTEIRSRLQRRLLRVRYAVDRGAGYPTYRTWEPRDAAEVVRRFRPDVAVVQNDDTGRTLDLARSLEAAGVPVVFYFRNVEMEGLGGDPASVGAARFVANSHFTAARYARTFGIRPTVIPPLVEPGLYRTDSTRENVTFINPVPVKGLDVALEVAGRCPDIPFVFVESWPIGSADRRRLETRLQRLPNVTLLNRTDDMKPIYGRARFLLAPSLWQEAWGRVATEAQFSGLPVVGSNRGGLPEAIGPGGVIVDAEAPVEEWVAAVRRLWDDPVEYDRLAREAACHAHRPEIDARRQLGMLIDVLCAAVRRGPGREASKATHLRALV